MAMEDQFQATRKKMSFSPNRSPSNSRLQFGGISQRMRSLLGKKPPEPLQKAVADCLSSHHGNPSTVASESARTLRDYLAAPSTTDVAYIVLLEHALAERERSPAVVERCVTVLKRYLLRYVPKEQTLQQIDMFCINTIAEYDSIANQRVPPWLKSLNQFGEPYMPSGNTFPASLPPSSFASGALVKSLQYVRSLVARHIPRRSFQPSAFTGASTSSKQSFPTLSSLLSRSFNSQLTPALANSKESPERKENPNSSPLNLSSPERNDEEDFKYISVDVLKWRWSGNREQLSSSVTTESDGVMGAQDVRTHSFLEVGAAALLVGDMEAKLKGQRWTLSGTREKSDFDKLLQPSTVTAATNFASAPSHLRAITASKRVKPGPYPVWEDAVASTLRLHARPLFQYRHYSEQQPLRLNAAEVSEVIAAICSDTPSSNANLMTMSSRLTSHSGKPSTDVAASVLIKLVIDMYVLDSGTAAPLTLSMLEEMLRSPSLASRIRTFDLILNLGVHAHLLEPILSDSPTIEEENPSQESYFNDEKQFTALVKRNKDPCKLNMASSAIDSFESWILNILYEILLLLVQTEEREETIWASALSCLLYFVCDSGKIWRNRLEGLDIRVIKVLLEISREHSWAEIIHCKLICMLTNMFYQVPNGSVDAVTNTPIFLVEQVDLLGGIEFICLEYSRANSKEEKRNLFLVLFDYVLCQINETSLATRGSEYSFDEIQPLATMLSLADAPEAFYISLKHGVEGIGQILRSSISRALSRYPNFERLNTLLEKITTKFDETIRTFTRLDEEYSDMIGITKSWKSLNAIEDGPVEVDIGMKVKLSWATLHSLLHSERPACRRNGYIWLVELLVSEISDDGTIQKKNKKISDDGNTSIWSNINNLQRQIGIAGSQDSSTDSSVPLSIWIMCGLLKSKYNFIRYGFLFILEKLLMRCKLLFDENKIVSYDHSDNRLEEANAVVDIMSSALSLVAQINETDRINILKMCGMLFSQLCLRFLHATGVPIGDFTCIGNMFGCTDENVKSGRDPNAPQHEKSHGTDKFLGESSGRNDPEHPPSICEISSMAALLLRGHAVVPKQLVARVPAALFYWPLIQLAGAATDDIALGVAVGSKGRGNLPGATSDIRAALLLLLVGKCTEDRSAFLEVGGEEFFRELLDDTDSRVAYYSSAFLLKRMMTDEPEKYQRMLQNLVFKAQQSNNEKLLENPYLQMRGIIQLSSDLATQL
ncbi:uncharacterized protein LOC143872822 [Tasmannia lanceolata]|uniref:uncharacterized protein LOC143872822 n=1 Tax=Tasmannia lanceolata TaxID=3420 RepID=UPI0040632A0A